MASGDSINRNINTAFRRINQRLDILQGRIASPEFSGKSLRNIGVSAIENDPKRALRFDETQDMTDHIAASTDVHGIGSGSSVVGTNTIQVLTNKTILWNINVVTVDYTVVDTDTFVFVYGEGITITLPAGTVGKCFFIGNMNTEDWTVLIKPSGTDEINDETEQIINPSDTAKLTYCDTTYTWRAT